MVNKDDKVNCFIHSYHVLYLVSQVKFSLPLQGVNHGSTVSLQLVYDKHNWLRCRPYGRTCLQGDCPGLYMECNDWSSCAGEVFEIYRVNGPGVVRVGDKVGLYFPDAPRYWFSMSGGSGHTGKCPGVPSDQNGFSDTCLGEIFVIYARGKGIGDAILEHDHIALYQVRVPKWIKLVPIHAPAHSTCLGNVRPPPVEAYNRCHAEIFEVWLQ